MHAPLLQPFRYRYWPEDLLDAIDLLTSYLLGRAPVRKAKIIADDGRYEGKWRRCIYGGKKSGRWHGNIAWAFNVLNVSARKKRFDGCTMWRLGPRWKYRLGLAGIDPETLEIVDQIRFNLAWEQIFEFEGKFYAEIQRERIAQGRQAPAAAMREDVRMKKISGAPKPKRKTVAERVERDKPETEYTAWMRGRIKGRLNGSQ